MNPQQQGKANWHKKNLQHVTDLLYELKAVNIASIKGPNGGKLDFTGTTEKW